MMLSALFSGDDILQAVFDDQDRISTTQHRTSEATGKVQQALLIWDPTCLPLHGVDNDYGSETADAVVRFKAEELGVPIPEIVNDVGPRTVGRLDQIAAAAENGLGGEFAIVTRVELTETESAAVLDAIEAVGGTILMLIGSRVAVVDGSEAVQSTVETNLADPLAGLLSLERQEIPGDLDEASIESLLAWLSTLDPAFVLEQLSGWAEPVSFETLGGCGRDEQ